MKKATWKKIGVFLFFLFLISINIVPVFIFREKIRINSYSLIAIFLLLVVVIRGIDAYIFRHKGNYLAFRRGSLTTFLPDEDYTFTPEYMRKFYRMLIIYCAAIPFYIPAICFSKKPWDPLWALFIYFVPQFVFFMQDVRQYRSDVKKYKQKEMEQEKELEQQKHREEFGRWK